MSQSFEFRGTDRFQVLRRLGAGGMGVVYEAIDRERSERVALKALPNVTADALARFKREFRALQDLAHPNLISLGELVASGSTWFFTMELVQGVDFLTWVRADASRLREALAQLVRGVLVLHAAGKVHRDIKPSNVLVSPQGRVVLLDFGLVLEREDTQEIPELVGTPQYMAPEQVNARRVGPAADWYAVGVMVYEALTGRVPFEGRTVRAKVHTPPTPPRDVTRDAPEDLEALCLDLLRIDPAERPTGDDVLRRLGAVSALSGATQPPASHSTPFVGRSGELAALAEAWGSARHANAVVVEVRGESGVGKTALVRRFIGSLVSDAPRPLVLAGRCYERESVPYKAFDGIIDALARWLAGLDDEATLPLLPPEPALLAQVFPVLARVSTFSNCPPPPALDPQEQHARLFASVRDLLARIANRHPLILVIDDFQWADQDSRALLAEVLRPPKPPPLLLLTTMRPEGKQLRCEPNVSRTLALGPLPRDDARRLAKELLASVGHGQSIAEALADEAGGHPLFIDELVRHARTRTTGPRPLRLEEAVWERVRDLDDPTRRLLELVSVAGVPVAQSAAAFAAGSSAEGVDFVRLVSNLRTAHLVRTSGASFADAIEVYHDRVREAVLANVPPTVLRLHHRALAVALEENGGADPETLAVHWRGAGDDARATRHAVAAAEQAEAALAFERAARLYRLALELGGGEGEQARSLRTRAGRALANAGRGQESAALLLAAVNGASTGEARALYRMAAEQLLITGHIDDGVRVLRDVLAGIGYRLPDNPKRALVSLLARRLALRLRGVRFVERSAVDIQPDVLTRIDTCWAASLGLAMVDSIRGSDFQTRCLLQSLSAGEPTRVARALALEAAYLAAEGAPNAGRAAALQSESQALAERFEDAHGLGMAVGVGKGAASFLLGRFRASLEACDQALRVLLDRCTGVTWELDTVHSFAMWALAYLGDLNELRRRHASVLREALNRGDLYLATNLRLGSLNLVWLASDHVDEARRQADLALREWSHRGFHTQHYQAVLSNGNLDLYAGRAQEAREVLMDRWGDLKASLLLRVQIIRCLSIDLRARTAIAAAATAAPSDRRRLLAHAEADVRRLEGERLPYATTLASMACAGARALRGDQTGAAAALERTMASAEGADMALHAALARRRLGQLRGGETGAGEVTAADEWMKAQGCARPDRMAATFAPGFAD